jgi:hypothetical protein
MICDIFDEVQHFTICAIVKLPTKNGGGEERITHKVQIYLEYHSVCPLVGLGTPSVPLPADSRGGWHTRLQVRGWGSPNSNDWRKSLALCLLCGIT